MNARRAREPARARVTPAGAVAKPSGAAHEPTTADDAARAKAKAERTAIERWEAEGGRTLPAERR